MVKFHDEVDHKTRLANEVNEVAIDDALAKVRAELVRATQLHGPMHTMHEAYGVIAEEFNKEFLDAVHANDAPQARKELVQVAAMACRALIDI